MPVPWSEEEQKIVKLHHWDIVEKPRRPSLCPPEAERLAKRQVNLPLGPITWTITDIAKASSLLKVLPIKPDFEDEQEMRRVYTLIYDSFRCE